MLRMNGFRLFPVLMLAAMLAACAGGPKADTQPAEPGAYLVTYLNLGHMTQDEARVIYENVMTLKQDQDFMKMGFEGPYRKWFSVITQGKDSPNATFEEKQFLRHVALLAMNYHQEQGDYSIFTQALEPQLAQVVELWGNNPAFLR